ncbi:hypothetical protein ACFOU2_06225 [Bacillus songklensis]|uniref:Uncharacterized protein n=1 Tax=Bacillus songklensis TaxID=1069116 RepID=A0ABV8B1Q4_9BACI
MEESKSLSMFNKKEAEWSTSDNPVFQVYQEDILVAEVRGTDPAIQRIIPMRELNDYEESKLHEYIGHFCSKS